MTHCFITTKAIPVEELTTSLQDPSCGGVATFMGKVRNHHEGKKVTGLTFEARIPMAEKIFDQIATEAMSQLGVKTVKIVHRIGELKLGDVVVWIGVQSAHRKEAFAACQYAIDQLKEKAPIWKKEHYPEGESQWITCSCNKAQTDVENKR